MQSEYILPIFAWGFLNMDPRLISIQYPRPHHWLRILILSVGNMWWLPTAPQKFVEYRSLCLIILFIYLFIYSNREANHINEILQTN